MSSVTACAGTTSSTISESQLEHELGAEEVDLFAEEERLRLGRLALRDRIPGDDAATRTQRDRCG